MELKSLDLTDKDTVKNDIRDIADLNALLKQISGVSIEELLEVERDEHLVYQRYQQTGNTRNGYSKKRVRFAMDIPSIVN